MKVARPAQRIEWIPLDRITVMNPRIRNKRVFREIVDNIAQIGLKRPITVTRRVEADGPFYDLVCGQGRLEAYQALGQSEIPALVVSADPEDCLIASLVENCARRQHSAFDLLQDIGGMRERGYSVAQIARKTGLYLNMFTASPDCSKRESSACYGPWNLGLFRSVSPSRSQRPKTIRFSALFRWLTRKAFCAERSCSPLNVWSRHADAVAKDCRLGERGRQRSFRPLPLFAPTKKTLNASAT